MANQFLVIFHPRRVSYPVRMLCLVLLLYPHAPHSGKRGSHGGVVNSKPTKPSCILLSGRSRTSLARSLFWVFFGEITKKILAQSSMGKMDPLLVARPPFYSYWTESLDKCPCIKKRSLGRPIKPGPPSDHRLDQSAHKVE